MRLINLTPHAVTINGITIPPSGTVARVQTRWRKTDDIDFVGFPSSVELGTVEYGEIEGLPAPQPGTMMIVSSIVLDAGKRAGRTDLCAPDTSPDSVLRDGEGRIVGVRRLII